MGDHQKTINKKIKPVIYTLEIILPDTIKMRKYQENKKKINAGKLRNDIPWDLYLENSYTTHWLTELVK